MCLSMKSVKLSGNIVELNRKFSTTRRVIKIDQSTDNPQKDRATESQFLSKQLDRCWEGGLRTHGYFKSSGFDKPLISVITVVYNGKKHIEQAILSVIGQGYDNVEYIIVDGESTDGTLDVIKKYDEVVDYWISEPDHGVYDAMNKGVNISHGDYLLFLGCDDSLFDVLKDVAGLLDKGMMSYYGDVILSKNKELYDGRFYSLKLFIKNIPHQAIFYSRHVFDEYGFNCKYKAVADYELNLKLFSNKKLGLKYIPKTIATYNNEDGVSSILNDYAFSLDKSVVIKKYYSTFYYIIYVSLRFLLKSKNS